MGVLAALLDPAGDPMRGLPDPSGGTFDAVGDSDRLLDMTVTLFDRIDPFGETTLEESELAELLIAISQQCRLELSSIERRGLLRLQALAHTARATGGTVKIFGD
jgi:hypothetical protein